MGGTDERSTYWSPSRNYELTIKVGGMDITNDLEQMYIISSVEIPQKIYIMDFFLDSGDVILEKMYGQKPLKLTIKTFGTSESLPHEIIEANLLVLGSKYDLLMKDSQPQIPDKTRSSMRIKAVSLEAYHLMNAFVNEVYLGTTLETIVSDLVSKSGGVLEYDSMSQNTEKIDQIIIPPAPLYQVLKYLNRTFGFFHGLAGIYSTAIKTSRKSNSAIAAGFPPKLFIRNLTQSIKTKNITITQLSSTSRQQEELFEVFDGKSFYTYNPVETEYTANTAFSLYGPTMKHIVKPRDELFTTLEIDTNDFANQFGLITKKNQLFVNTLAQSNRVGFFKDHTGYDKSETHIEANYSKPFSRISLLKIHLEKFLLLDKLMQVGTGIKFNSYVTDVRDLTGDYIMQMSQVHFIRAKRDWECGVTLHAIRTNRVS